MGCGGVVVPRMFTDPSTGPIDVHDWARVSWLPLDASTQI